MSTERVGIYVEVRGAESALDKLRALDDIINRLNNKKINIDLGSAGQIKGLVNATENARRYSQEVDVASTKTRTLGDAMKSTFNSISSKMMHTGQQMQVLGKTLTQISTPFRTLMRSTLFASGFKVLNSVTEGISKGFSRYDTMKKYPKVMQAFGYSADQAQKSIDKLDLSVRGLPTGLDEMVDMAQRFTATTGNIEKGTDLAIAANNAFLASMSTDTQKYQGMMQLQDVLGGKDMNAREWNSLVSSMTPAIVKMGESLGYTSDNMSEWIQKVRDGKVSNEDFIDTLIKVGTEGGSVAKMAENSKDTWQAFFANVGNATSRMTAGVIKALDEVSQVVAGKDLNRLFSDTIIPGIDNLAKSVQDWIRANPDVIIDFFNQIKSFDFQGMFRGAGKGLLKTLQDYLKIFKLFTGKDGEAFGVFMARAGFYGKALNLVGGMLKGMRGLGGAIGAGIRGLIGVRPLAKAGGIFGFLGKIIGSKKDVDTVAKTAGKIPTLKQSFGKIVNNLSGLMTLFGGTALAVGTGFIAFKGFKSMFKDLKEIVGILRDFEGVDWKYAGGTLVGIAGFLGTFALVGKAIGKAVMAAPTFMGTGAAATLLGELLIGAVTGLATAIVRMDMAFIEGAFNSFKNITESLKKGIENLKDFSKLSDSTNNIENLKKAVEVYNSMVPTLMGVTGTKSIVKNKAEVIKAISGMVGSLKKSMEDLKNLPEMSEAELETAKTKISDVLSKIGTLYEELEKEFKDDYVVDAQNGDTFLKSVAGMVKSIVGTIGDLKALEEVDIDLDVAKDNIAKVSEKMFEVYEEIRTAFEDFADLSGGGGKGSPLAKAFGMRTIEDKEVNTAENAGTIVSTIMQMISDIKSVVDMVSGEDGLGSLNIDDFTSQMEKLTGEEGVISQLKTMYDKLVSEQEGFGGESDVDLSEITSSFSTAIDNIKNAVTGIQEIGAINFEGDGGINSIVTSIKTLIENLKNAFNAEAIAGLQAQVEAFKAQITAIKTSIESIGGEEGGINVDLTINHTITGDTETVEDLNSAYEAISSARSSIEGLSGSIRINVPISASVTGVNSAVKKMLKAAAKLRAARAILRAAGGGGGNVSAGAYTGGYLAGGSKVLYRASGGDIAFPGKPRGSDTIPLWASRGEFVHNRHAVDFFGIDFMRKINRLDMRGALNDLMTKAGGMASIGRHSVVNNTYNNNQKVIQNINTNSVDFAFKSASRFAGAF